MTSFRHRVHPESGEEAFRDLQREKDRTVGKGVDQLRRLRSAIFAAESAEEVDTAFASALTLANQIADFCLADTQNRADPLAHHSYHGVLAELSPKLSELEAQSKHHIVPNQVAHHLRRAAEDLMIRVEEQVGSLSSPQRLLDLNAAREVLQEFLLGTNCLTIDAQKAYFAEGTAVGGLLSGGLVYALMAGKVLERYGDESISQPKILPVAVDGEGKRGRFALSVLQSTAQVERLILVDDMIDRGGSMHCAVTAAEDVFTKSDIHSGVRTSYAKGRIPPSQAVHISHLSNMFQDFADLTESGELDAARVLLVSAFEYASENGVIPQRGWYKRAARFFADSAQITGKDPYPS
jgi:hypothetical protein